MNLQSPESACYCSTQAGFLRDFEDRFDGELAHQPAKMARSLLRWTWYLVLAPTSRCIRCIINARTHLNRREQERQFFINGWAGIVFDLILTPLNFAAARALPELPEFLATAAPRRSDRHRSSDLLAVYLSSPGGQPLSPDLLKEAFQLLSSTYFRTGGTVTSAIKDAVEALNENLLSRSERAPVILVLNLCIIRNNLAYIAHAGPARTFLLTAGGATEHYDASSTGRGLGASRAVPLRFFQASLEPGDALIFSPEPLSAWPSPLSAATVAELKTVHNIVPADLRAGLLRVKTGTGQVQIEPLPAQGSPTPVVEAAPAPVVESPPAPQPVSPVAEPEPAAETPPEPEPVVEAAEAPAVEHESLPTTPVISQARRRVEERRGRTAEPAQAAPEKKFSLGGLVQRGETAAAPAKPAPDKVTYAPAERPFVKRLAAFFRRIRRARARAGRSMGAVLPHLAPEEQAAFNPSPATLFFIAVAIPIIVVAAAMAVYFRSGAGEQRTAYLEQARVFAEMASAEDDLTQRRANWEQVVYWVNKSEEFGSDDESITLRRKAQVAMDSLDGIVRLQLAPAFTGVLADSINVTRMAATNTELYLLDANSGRVLRMERAGRTYEYDANFSCGPGPYGSMIVGPLVGLNTLPPNTKSGADIVAIDATGNLLYCSKDNLPLSSTLSPPENNWGRITAMAVQNGDLFVLDLQNNAVWRFDGDDFTYTDRPRLFFGNEVPLMADVIDLTLYQDDLYLLRSSGMMTVCTYSGFDFSPTRCNDPAPYGGPDGAVESFADTGFLQMLTTQPPDPSLFILDSKGPSIYHFSLRLNFQRELRQDPEQERDFPLPKKPVTAFAMSPNRVVFLAFSNQVVFGSMP